MAGVAAKTASMVGKTGSVGQLVGYFGFGIAGATGVAYARKMGGAGIQEREGKENGVAVLREGRKGGIGEYRRSASFEGKTTHMTGTVPERAHHMRTGQLTLRRQSSFNPNIRRKLSQQKAKEDAAAAE